MLRELQGNIIHKSTILLNFEKLGYHTRAHIILKVNHEDKKTLKKHLLCNENVNNLHKINDGFDFLIETTHKNNRELDNFLDNLYNNFKIEKKKIHYLIEDIKREGFKFF
jgi:DNA-binding Lrp family transcriptional regulator